MSTDAKCVELFVNAFGSVFMLIHRTELQSSFINLRYKDVYETQKIETLNEFFHQHLYENAIHLVRSENTCTCRRSWSTVPSTTVATATCT